jgi:hypothetical protein
LITLDNSWPNESAGWDQRSILSEDFSTHYITSLSLAQKFAGIFLASHWPRSFLEFEAMSSVTLGKSSVGRLINEISIVEPNYTLDKSNKVHEVT